MATALLTRGARALARLRALWSQVGAFDLPSILVGVVVVGILTAGVLAALFSVIPFAQDNAAKQDLDAVRTAEGVAKSQLNGFKDKGGLLTGGLMSDARTLAVGTNAEANCYVGISKSATGVVFYNSDKTTKPEILTSTTDTGCVDAAAQDQLLDDVGGFTPHPNDNDGDGIPNAEDPTPNGPDTDGDGTPDAQDPTPNGPDSDGDGIPDATDPTPNGGASDPDALPAGYTWSDRAVATNSIKDPSFQLGSTGWTTPRPSSVAKSVGHAPGIGIDGGSSVTMITSGTAASNQENYAFLALPSRAGGNEAVNIKVFSNMGVQAAYGSIVTHALDGSFLHETGVTTTYVGGTYGWQLMRVAATPWHAAANPPEGFTRYLKIRVGGNYNDANLEDYQIYMDQVGLLVETQDYFDGNTASAGEYSYAWSGELHDSVSKKSTTKQISSPSDITRGQDFTVTGRGFPANASVTVREYDRYDNYIGSVTVTTDGAGEFTTTLNIPTTAPVGPAELDVRTDPTYENPVVSKYVNLL